MEKANEQGVGQASGQAVISNPAVKVIELRSGQSTLEFEPDTGYVRYVRVGDHEVVRAIYVAVRDTEWNLVEGRIANVRVEQEAGGFRLNFDVSCADGNIQVDWTGEVVGFPDGRITYTFRGEALADFTCHRIGICVLHPIVECAGKPCTIEKVDGTREEGTFPQLIAPDPIFTNIRAMAHEVVAGVKVEVRFGGEVFEMEDQRNWSDASFKTYCPPLSRPGPVTVLKGTRIEQSVTISYLGQPRKILPVLLGRPAQISIATTPVLAKPLLGLCAGWNGDPMTALELERLRRLRLNHLRVDLALWDEGWVGRLELASREGAQIGASLHLALHLTDDAESELKRFVNRVAEVRPNVGLWMIFHREEKVTGERWVQLAGRQLAGMGSKALIAAGTNSDFVELNTNRPGRDVPALPCYSINPQVHARDDRTLVENLAAQAMTVDSVRSFSMRSVVVSRVTLRPRPTWNLEAKEAGWDGDRLPEDVDVRQASLLGAGWTLGSIAGLAGTGNLHSVTYYETRGWRGVMERESGPARPDLFPSRAGQVFPVYHLLAEMAGYNRICIAHSSHPLQLVGLMLLDEKNRRRMLVANLLGIEQEAKIKTGVCQGRVRYLDDRNLSLMLSEPERFGAEGGEVQASVSAKIELKLRPHALAVVDLNS